MGKQTLIKWPFDFTMSKITQLRIVKRKSHKRWDSTVAKSPKSFLSSLHEIASSSLFPPPLPLFLSVSLTFFMHPWHLEKYARFVLMVSFITLFQYLFTRGETYSTSWKNQTMVFFYPQILCLPVSGCTHYLVLHRGNTQTLSSSCFFHSYLASLPCK